MAKVDIKMPDEFLLKVSKLGSDFDPVAEKILKAGGEVIFKRTKSNLSAVEQEAQSGNENHWV